VFVRAQTPDSDVQKVATLLAASKYTATRATGRNPTQPVWHIPGRGPQMGSFTVIVTTQNGILITFVIVAPDANIRKTPELVAKVLQLNHEYDYVKAGFDADGDAFVRTDIRVRILDVQELNDIVGQIANTAEAMYGALKPFLIR
jgi:hypothetical protein